MVYYDILSKPIVILQLARRKFIKYLFGAILVVAVIGVVIAVQQQSTSQPHTPTTLAAVTTPTPTPTPTPQSTLAPAKANIAPPTKSVASSAPSSQDAYLQYLQYCELNILPLASNKAWAFYNSELANDNQTLKTNDARWQASYDSSDHSGLSYSILESGLQSDQTGYNSMTESLRSQASSVYTAWDQGCSNAVVPTFL